MSNGDPTARSAVVLDPGADDFLSQLRNALAMQPERELVIDLRTVGVADPQLLRDLSAVADAARAAERQVVLVGAGPEVYKALHVAGLATAFQRG